MVSSYTWVEIPGINCFDGHGGHSLETPPDSAFERDYIYSVHDCQVNEALHHTRRNI